MLKLIRFNNSLFAGIAGFLSYFIVHHSMDTNSLLIFLSVFFITGGGNIFNDIIDYEVDIVNRPQRPLPSGKVSLNTARLMFFLFNLLGLIFAFFIDIWHGLIAAGVIFGLYLYNSIYKLYGIIGNIMVSFFSSLVFIYGAFSFDIKIVFISILSFLLSLSREILKDYEDREGDKLRGRKVFYSLKTVKIMTISIIVILIVICFAFMYLYNFSQYLLYIAILFLLLGCYTIIKEKITLSIRVHKFLMFYGILILVLL